MKNIFEHLATTIVLMLFIYLFTSIMIAETQITHARHLHNQIIEEIQLSYYTADVDYMNEKLHEIYTGKNEDGEYKWNIEIQKNINTFPKQDWLVSLNYTIDLPLFNISKPAKIEGYAR